MGAREPIITPPEVEAAAQKAAKKYVPNAVKITAAGHTTDEWKAMVVDEMNKGTVLHCLHGTIHNVTTGVVCTEPL
jgi:hypothetical protein